MSASDDEQVSRLEAHITQFIRLRMGEEIDIAAARAARSELESVRASIAALTQELNRQAENQQRTNATIEQLRKRLESQEGMIRALPKQRGSETIELGERRTAFIDRPGLQPAYEERGAPADRTEPYEQRTESWWRALLEPFESGRALTLWGIGALLLVLLAVTAFLVLSLLRDRDDKPARVDEAVVSEQRADPMSTAIATAREYSPGGAFERRCPTSSNCSLEQIWPSDRRAQSQLLSEALFAASLQSGCTIGTDTRNDGGVQSAYEALAACTGEYGPPVGEGDDLKPPVEWVLDRLRQ